MLSKIRPPGPGSYSIERKASIESLVSNQHHSSLPREDRFKDRAAVAKVILGRGRCKRRGQDRESTTRNASL